MPKVAIAGFGREGKLILDYFLDKNLEIHVFDTNSNLQAEVENLGAVFHPNLDIPTDFAEVYKSPGIPNFKLKIDIAKTKIRGLTNIFLQEIKGTIIGVTGTKGKSTVSTLIHHILKENGRNVELIGNLGQTKSLNELDLANPNKIFVYEMSSYMCEFLDQKSPHTAVFTNFYPDHLDYHLTLENYFAAKAKITQFQNQNDFFITIPQVAKKIDTKAKTIAFTLENIKTPFQTGLLGDHNQLNCQMALEVAKILCIDEQKARQSIHSYKPLSGRLEKIAEKKGVTFYEDALATIPEATWSAICALSKEKSGLNTIILGGQDRGIDFEDFAKKLTTTNINNFIVLPDTGQKMVKYISKSKIHEAKNMPKIIDLAFQLTKGICLLSTASPSYNLFKNYEDRSRQYRECIEKYQTN